MAESSTGPVSCSDNVYYSGAGGATIVPVGSPPQTCPHCGWCPTCGRPGQSWPAWPQYPPYYVGDPPWWYYQTWCTADTAWSTDHTYEVHS